MVQRILVATDRSDTATRAVTWAAEMAGRYAAELLVLQVITTGQPPGADGGPGPEAGGQDQETGREEDGGAGTAAGQLAAFTRQVGGERARSIVVYDSDPADAIVRVCEAERVDLVVVGNVGMRGRTTFLLGNVPNRVSHNARCSVVIYGQHVHVFLQI